MTIGWRTVARVRMLSPLVAHSGHAGMSAFVTSKILFADMNAINGALAPDRSVADADRRDRGRQSLSRCVV